MRLALEIALARTAGRLSRLAARGGGTTLPGKILARIDSDAISTLASRLPEGAALISATNGKTTTASMAAEILGRRFHLAHNRAGANLVSASVSVGASQRASSKQEILAGGYASAGAGSIGASQGAVRKCLGSSCRADPGTEPRHDAPVTITPRAAPQTFLP